MSERYGVAGDVYLPQCQRDVALLVMCLPATMPERCAVADDVCVYLPQCHRDVPLLVMCLPSHSQRDVAFLVMSAYDNAKEM